MKNRKKVLKSILKLAKEIIDEEEIEEIEDDEDEIEDEESEKKDLIKLYNEGEISDVLDELEDMKPMNAVYYALKIYESLKDEASKSGFMRVTKRRMRQE